MLIKPKALSEYLDKNGMTVAGLACKMSVKACEVEKLLNGETAGVNLARKFIYCIGADTAQHLIDWDALGKKNPLACEADNENKGEDKHEDDNV